MARFIRHQIYDLRGLGLKPIDRELYSVMANDCPFFRKNKGIYSPSIDNLRELLEVSRMTISNSLKKLEEVGLITSIPRAKGLTTAYEVHKPSSIERVVPAVPEGILWDWDEAEENPF